MTDLPWARWWQRRCWARTARWSRYYGRCELLAGHVGDHALERGMDTPRWSTKWTDQ